MAYGYPQQPSITNIPQIPTSQSNSQQIMGQQNIQPLFPQPQGNVYNINSTLEVANVPVGAGVSVALCLPEGVMYIKTMQNGNPLFYPYKIIPFNNEVQEEKQQVQEVSSQSSITIEQLAEQLKICCDKIAALESQLNQNQTKNKKGADWDI